MKAYVRAVQTFFPMLQDARFRIQRTVQRATRSVHDPDWLAFKRLRVGDRIILDVGANRGLSIESFRIALPGRPIVAFEPNPRLAGKLEQEYGSSDNVRIEPVALSDAPGAAKLYLPRYRNYVFDSLASMERAEAMEWLGSDNFKGFDARRLTCLEMDITTRTLDTYGLAPSVIKLDTQGSEEKVLCGGLQTIASTRPIILLEGATPSIRELLMQFNYRAYVFDNGELIPDRMDARNVFFLTPERLRPTS